LSTLGIGFADFTPVFLDFAAGGEAIESGAAEAQLQCPIPNKVMTALAARANLRVLPYAAGELEALLRAVPFYRRTVMRKNAIRGLDVDMPQAAVVNVLVSHARVADAKVRDVTASIVAARDELPRLNALFAGLRELFDPLHADGVRAFEFGGVALHPGALAAYRTAGLLG